MARAGGIPNPAAGPLPAAREARLIHPVLLLGFFFFKLAGIYLFLQSLPTHKPNLGSKQKCLNRRSETKQKASGRPAPAALTSPLGARRLYLGTATVCGAAAPSGTAQNADFPDNRPQQLRQNH